MSTETRTEQQNTRDESARAVRDNTSQASKSLVEFDSASDFNKVLEKMGTGFQKDKSAQFTVDTLEFKPINTLVALNQFDGKPFSLENSYKGDAGLLDGAGRPRSENRVNERALPEGLSRSLVTDGNASMSSSTTERAARDGRGDATRRKDNGDAQSDKVNLKGERTRLDKEAKTNLSPEEYRHFKESMQQFEARKGQNGLTEQEIARTYHEVGRLFEAKGNKPLNPQQRKDIAQQVMENAAEPTHISQGNNNTCNVTTVETAMYTRHPSDAAKLVADVSLTGKYTTKSGSVIETDPTPRTDASRNYPPRQDGQRVHASEIFQITAVNAYYKDSGIPRRYDQVQVPPPQNRTDNGERLYDTSKDPNSTEEAKDRNGKPYRNPGLYTADLVKLGINLTGTADITALMSPSYGGTDSNVGSVSSEKELEDKLAQAKKDGKFPMIVLVNTAVEPLYGDSGAGSAGGSGGAHVVTVTDFQPGPPAKVSIDNQWQNSKDYQDNRKMSVHDLYKVMQSNDEALKITQQEVTQARNEGRVDVAKETELLRMQKMQKQIGDAEYEKNLNDLIKRTDDDFKKREPQASVFERWTAGNQLSEAAGKLPIDKNLTLLDQMRDTGLLAPSSHQFQVGMVGWKLAQQKKDLESTGKMSGDEQKKYEADIKIYQDYLNRLPADQKQRVLEFLKQNGA